MYRILYFTAYFLVFVPTIFLNEPSKYFFYGGLLIFLLTCGIQLYNWNKTFNPIEMIMLRLGLFLILSNHWFEDLHLYAVGIIGAILILAGLAIKYRRKKKISELFFWNGTDY